MLIMPFDIDLQLRLVLMHLTNCHLLEREQHVHMQCQQLHEWYCMSSMRVWIISELGLRSCMHMYECQLDLADE